MAAFGDGFNRRTPEPGDLNAGWTEVGVGMRQGGSYGIYWAQVFGRR